MAAIDAKLKRMHMLEMIINISYILKFSWNSETTAKTQVTWEDVLMNPWQSLGVLSPSIPWGWNGTVLFPAERLEIPTFPLKGCSHLLP